MVVVTRCLEELPLKDLKKMVKNLDIKPAFNDRRTLLDVLERAFLFETQSVLNVVGAYYTSKRLNLK